MARGAWRLQYAGDSSAVMAAKKWQLCRRRGEIARQLLAAIEEISCRNEMKQSENESGRNIWPMARPAAAASLKCGKYQTIMAVKYHCKPA